MNNSTLKTIYIGVIAITLIILIISFTINQLSGYSYEDVAETIATSETATVDEGNDLDNWNSVSKRISYQSVFYGVYY